MPRLKMSGAIPIISYTHMPWTGTTLQGTFGLKLGEEMEFYD
jgi:hypothetical protein